MFVTSPDDGIEFRSFDLISCCEPNNKLTTYDDTMYLKGLFIFGFTTLPNSSRAPCTGCGQGYVEWSVSQGEGKGQTQAKGWCGWCP